MQDHNNITIMGLGTMGKAVAATYAKQGYFVHAWNRGEENRQKLQDMELPNVTIYSDPTQAVQQSPLVLMMVLADPMLATAESIIQQVDEHAWKGKTLVQFTSHEPFGIHEQETLMESMDATLIGGAMLGVSTTVGTKEGIFLLSPKEPQSLQKHMAALTVLGTLVPFLQGDTGLASLADIGLLQTLQFGLAGNELSCFMFTKYGVDEEFQRIYQELLPKTSLPMIDHLSKLSAQAVFRGDYSEQAKVYTTDCHLAVYESHLFFFEKMGLVGPTYLSVYLDRFRKVKGSDGPSAIVNTYTFV